MGNGTAGATEGADIEAIWINAQMGQSKSADPSDAGSDVPVHAATVLDAPAATDGIALADAGVNP
jgi:hypothetical protein